MLANRRYALVGRLFDVADTSFEVILFLFEDLNINDIAGNPNVDEDHATFGFGYRHAFAAGIDDFDVFQIFGLFLLFHFNDI